MYSALDEGVVSQATDNNFTLMKAWAALLSVLQRLLSMEKLISLSVLMVLSLYSGQRWYKMS